MVMMMMMMIIKIDEGERKTKTRSEKSLNKWEGEECWIREVRRMSRSKEGRRRIRRRRATAIS